MNDTTVKSFYLYELNPNKPISVRMGISGRDQTYFESIEDARNSNYHGEYKNRTKYKVGSVWIITKHVDIVEDLDPPTPEERIRDEKEIEFWQRVNARVVEIQKTREDNGDPCDVEEEMLLPIDVAFNLRLIEMMDEIKESNAQTED